MNELEELRKVVEALNSRIDELIASFHPVEDTSDRMISQAAAARMLGTNSQKMIRLRRNGQLRATKIGGNWLYSTRELRAYQKRYTMN